MQHDRTESMRPIGGIRRQAVVIYFRASSFALLVVVAIDLAREPAHGAQADAAKQAWMCIDC
jgi:hypothetical protein